MPSNPLLRQIPKVDELLRQPALLQQQYHHSVLLQAVRAELDSLRAKLIAGECNEVPSTECLSNAVLARANCLSTMSLRRVINATGIVLHTNLGRAPLSKSALQAVYDAASGYSTLEYDAEKGARGNRGEHIEPLLCELTGAQAAMAVNNNAAAILLTLSTLANNREIIVSRGELVEIGDSFRVPDIMEQSGGRLVEVGATNKTHLRDYVNAITDQTAVFLKVHTSNYKIIGFSGDVPLTELAKLGKQRNIPVVYDLGSGALLDEHAYPISIEPTVPQALRDGADIVTFSGDKLLGGPQAGIIVGSAECINRMKRSPLARALRLDKLSLAALEATLHLYRDPVQACKEIPALRMLFADIATLTEKAQLLCQKILDNCPGYTVEVVRQQRQAGGGSLPAQVFPTAAVAIAPYKITVTQLEQKLRAFETPIIARISENRLLLDVSTIDEHEFDLVAQGVANAL
ncbi:L-seryl-tRNA(Sec) selenium transferase [Hydrogenoanaerobacterium saccharovorans]|uniref:L-seryl-tRNA(Sec) selenium transferase n=1 Tax=Hydrogenoanaerobacterium saccharovorans TaxID=474960 RepID=A0A1H7Z3C7_9FIRM|nr:L-seryl-tRNA(Sec) selenium transferase [Hydrogenoanaerobacterium saccharovorans]RPF48891.1 L-seryl-tRNA(Sec) selenium transferase [Hydrogenoanaerobacterium saccharovorans]SEM51989.1 L-seryl-tRNA(Sec) selenium transferase [Hydrogenoanaerobacterium saccharovorans]